jgi:replication fork clamp-binding protein CrfC
MKFITTVLLLLCLTSFRLNAQIGLTVEDYIATHAKVVVRFDVEKFNRELNRYVKNANKNVVSEALLRQLKFSQPIIGYATSVFGNNVATNGFKDIPDLAASMLLYFAESKLFSRSKNIINTQSGKENLKDFSKIWGN